MATSETMRIIVQMRNDAERGLRDLNKELEGTGEAAEESGKEISGFNGKLKNLRSSLFGIKGAILGVVAAFGAFKAYRYVKESTLLAARYKTLAVTLETVGARAGYTASQLREFEKQLEKTGIAGIETRTILTRMLQAQLDLTKATELGRVAQNAAVIANLNSSETFERMLHAIQANSVEILRTIGMNVSFEKSYKIFARTLDVGIASLTEAQKAQARFNAVLKGGEQITGAYIAAMSTAGKQIKSFERYVQKFRISIGQAFEPALAEVVKNATVAMKEFIKVIQKESFQKTLEELGRVIGEEIKLGFKWIVDNKELVISAFSGIAKVLTGMVKASLAIASMLVTVRETSIMQLTSMLRNQEEALESHYERRRKIIKKITGETLTPFETDKNIKSQLENVEIQIARATKKILSYREQLKKYEEESEKGKKERPDIAKLQYQDWLQFTASMPKKQKPLGSTLLATSLSKMKSDVQLELAKIKSLYDQSLVSLDGYYEERLRLARKVFEEEKKLMEGQIRGQKDPDKRVKLEAKLYALKKQFAIKELGLVDEKRVATKNRIEEELNLEKLLYRAKLAIMGGDSSLKTKHEVELEELRLAQEERYKMIVDSRTKENQRIAEIEELHRLDQLEKDKLQAQQRKEIQERYMEGVRGSLSDLNSFFGDLYTASNQKIKEFARAQKAIAIVQTIISTIESAQKAYTQYAAWPPLAIIAATTATMAGMARVAAIRAQKFGKGGQVKGHSPTSTSDNIPIDATAGEFMQPVSAVKKFGLNFMESVKNLSFPANIARHFASAGNVRTPRSSRYAEGGLISSSGSQQTNNNITTHLTVESPLGRRLREEIERVTIKVLREEMR